MVKTTLHHTMSFIRVFPPTLWGFVWEFPWILMFGITKGALALMCLTYDSSLVIDLIGFSEYGFEGIWNGFD